MTLLQARTTKVLVSGVLVFVACGFADIIPATDPLGPITVMNPSFETLPLGGLGLGCGTNCRFSNGPIPGWTTASSIPASGQIQPGPGQFSSLPDGPTSAYTNGPTISQTVGATVEAGIEYILAVDLGARLDQPFAGSADLLIGPSMIVPATGVTPTLGNWSTFTATFMGTAADAGDSITIQLVSGRVQGNFDNVQLTAVPEPSFMGVVGIGLAGLLAFARRNRLRLRDIDFPDKQA